MNASQRLSEPMVQPAPRGGMLGRGAVVAICLGVEFGAVFFRTVILARMLDAPEFGLVALINATIAILESSTTFLPGRYLVFTADGASRPALAAVHAVTVVRAVILSVFVLVAAAPLANLMGQPEFAGSFAALAVLPMLRGFMHFGLAQQQRAGRFWPFAVAESSAAVVGLIAAIVAALILRDHRAILWSLGAQLAWMVAMAHYLSHSPYQVEFNGQRIRDVLRFGMPLIINGVALAASSQVDRLIVGARLGVVALGSYGLTMTVALQPISLLLRFTSTVLQPRLSSAWHADSVAGYRRLTSSIAAGTGVLGFAGAIGTVCLGRPVFDLIFGAKYPVSDWAFIILALVAQLRLGRGVLNLFGVASGRTADLMFSNLFGCFSLVATFIAVTRFPFIESALCGLLLAELLSFGVGCARLEGGANRPALPMSRVAVAAAIPAGFAAMWVVMTDPSLGARGAVAAAGVAVALALAWRLYRRYRHAA